MGDGVRNLHRNVQLDLCRWGALDLDRAQVAARVEHRHSPDLIAGQERAPAGSTESGRSRDPLILLEPPRARGGSRVMTRFLDSHPHLADPAVDDAPDAVLARA